MEREEFYPNSPRQSKILHWMLRFIRLRNGDSPEPMQAGDAKCDGIVNWGDVVFLVRHLYKEGPLPGCF
jgi:hypothetical protein